MNTVPSTPVQDHARAHRALVAAVEQLPLPLAQLLLTILHDGLDLAQAIVEAAPALYPDEVPFDLEQRAIMHESALKLALSAYLRALGSIDDRFPDEIGDLTAPQSV
ncbi:hypothetical protein GCM10023215_02300 [Pseudonocardia yuanmonensis]|uniref:Segregation/condensation protein A n=1 Tax=Pseudonocardia yuanmonensis TaxID=1095914 RepID=A0ABP8VW21_9PSEU